MQVRFLPGTQNIKLLPCAGVLYFVGLVAGIELEGVRKRIGVASARP